MGSCGRLSFSGGVGSIGGGVARGARVALIVAVCSWRRSECWTEARGARRPARGVRRPPRMWGEGSRGADAATPGRIWPLRGMGVGSSRPRLRRRSGGGASGVCAGGSGGSPVRGQRRHAVGLLVVLCQRAVVEPVKPGVRVAQWGCSGLGIWDDECSEVSVRGASLEGWGGRGRQLRCGGTQCARCRCMFRPHVRR